MRRMSFKGMIFISMMVCLYLGSITYEAGAACSPMTTGEWGPLRVPLSGSGDAASIPISAMAYSGSGSSWSQLGSPCSAPNNYVQMTFSGGGCYSWTQGMVVQGNMVFYLYGHSSCPTGANYYVSFGFYCSNTSSSTRDFDCDGQFDNVDPYHWEYTDTDGDGVIDANDPWPNDNTLPGTDARWHKWLTYTRASDGAVWTEYTDGNGNYFSTWTGGGTAPTPDEIQTALAADPNSWRGKMFFNSVGETYAQINPYIPRKETGEPGGNMEGSGTVERLLGEILRKETSSDGKLSDISGGLSSSGDIYGKLSEIKGAIDGIEGGQGTDMGPTNTKIDTTNSELLGVKTAVEQVRDKIVPLGEGDIPGASSGDVSQVQDNSSISDGENASKLQTEKNLLTSALNAFWANNPIKSIVQNSGVTASGGSSFVLNAGFGSTTVDLSSLGPGLETAGFLLVGIAGLGGIIIVLRN